MTPPPMVHRPDGTPMPGDAGQRTATELAAEVHAQRVFLDAAGAVCGALGDRLAETIRQYEPDLDTHSAGAALIRVAAILTGHIVNAAQADATLDPVDIANILASAGAQLIDPH